MMRLTGDVNNCVIPGSKLGLCISTVNQFTHLPINRTSDCTLHFAMRPVAGVFPSRENAERGYAELRRAGFSPDDINFLTPGSSEEQVHSIPTSPTEQPGVGKAIGGAVGAALGMAGGFELGVGLTALVPGVGPVLAAGLAGMALFGAGGAMAGAAAGSKADQDSTEGLPSDEIFFYEDALRQGRSVIIAMANGAGEATRAREILAESGAESLDAAREAWWIGLQDAESEHYRVLGYNFEQDRAAYRAGFEAALRPALRGKSHAEVAESLKREFPESETEAFRAGFARGRQYREEQLLARR
jgi:hypothetical protein